MSKIKVLTVQFDVTGFSNEAISDLKRNLELQGEFKNHVEWSEAHSSELEADLFNSSVREVKTEEV